MPTEPQHLIFDADDTLWENNVLFERTIDDFIEWIDHPTLDPVAVRHLLLDIERANAAAHGYGSKVFLRSLHDCFERLAERPVDDADVADIGGLTVPAGAPRGRAHPRRGRHPRRARPPATTSCCSPRVIPTSSSARSTRRAWPTTSGGRSSSPRRSPASTPSWLARRGPRPGPGPG